ncbi:MAG: type II secretion system protein [Deltaproteobacteria bacterium]|nr:type II secretion system protein [Deltaproteobacteria bacterium]
MKKRNRQSGFSLIELMVVVALLSVAAAIIVPRFLVHKAGSQEELPSTRPAN